MTYETKTISLKNGTNAVIVQPDPDRAEEMLEFLKDISSETEFISRTAEEVWETVEVERQKLEYLVNAEDMIILVCMVENRIAENCHLHFQGKVKTRHRATVGIRKAALVVFSHNEEGNRFWEKMGFTAREDLVYRNRMV